MNGDIFQRGNTTRLDAQYRRIEQSSMLCDRVQIFCLIVAGLLFLSAIALIFLRLNPVVCVALAAVLIWIRPAFCFLRKKRSQGEIKTVFCARDFIQTADGKKTRYGYTEIKRVTIFDNWILLKLRRKRIFLDANGFVFLSTEELVGFLHKNFPKISVKRRKKRSLRRRILPLLLATIFCITATGAAAYFRQRSDRPKRVAQINEVPMYGELTERDCDWLSIDLPEELTRRKEGEKLYFEDAQVTVRIEFTGKTSSLREYVEAVYEHNKGQDGVRMDEIFVSKMRNLCLQSEKGDRKTYSVFIETIYCYANLLFHAPKADYDAYLPYFEAWEKTIVVHEIPSSSELKLWETEDIRFFMPKSFVQQENNSVDLLLEDEHGTSVRVSSREKSYFEQGTPREEIFQYFLPLIEQAPQIVFFETSEFGNLTYTYSFGAGIIHEFYAVFLETENRYVVVSFKGKREPLVGTVNQFREWESMIAVK